MGLLDDAIKEHLDLKRRRGADPTEVERAEREALGPVRRNREAPDASEGDDEQVAAGGLAYDQAGDADWAYEDGDEPPVEGEPGDERAVPPLELSGDQAQTPRSRRAEQGLEITHVIDTHDHADHVSGRPRLVQATGAQVHRAGTGDDHAPDLIRA